MNYKNRKINEDKKKGITHHKVPNFIKSAGDAIVYAGRRSEGDDFDFKKGQEDLMRVDKEGEATFEAGLFWKEFDYKKGLAWLKEKNMDYYYKAALENWPKRTGEKVNEDTSVKRKRKVPSFFTEEEKELYRTLSKEQRGHIQYMSEGKARNYLFSCLNETKRVSGADIMKEISGIASNEVYGRMLSKRVNEEDLGKRKFKCKFCGQSFRSDEMRNKHQKLCM